MFKKLLLISFLIKFSIVAFSQYTFVPPTQGTDLNCHVNVNERADQNVRNDIKRAVFSFNVGFGNCTGTLINRNTGQGTIGLILTKTNCLTQ